jgi:hypothetical protein
LHGYETSGVYCEGMHAREGGPLGGDQGLLLRTLGSAIPGLVSLGFHDGSALQAPPVKYAGGSAPDRPLTYGLWEGRAALRAAPAYGLQWS